MLLSEKMTLLMAGWSVVVLFVTGEEQLELFFILIFIGTLVIRELSDVFSPIYLKDRLNVFIYIFIVIFIIIVGKKIITILGI